MGSVLAPVGIPQAAPKRASGLLARHHQCLAKVSSRAEGCKGKQAMELTHCPLSCCLLCPGSGAAGYLPLSTAPPTVLLPWLPPQLTSQDHQYLAR